MSTQKLKLFTVLLAADKDAAPAALIWAQTEPQARNHFMDKHYVVRAAAPQDIINATKAEVSPEVAATPK
jgi:hypothetical protein